MCSRTQAAFVEDWRMPLSAEARKALAVVDWKRPEGPALIPVRWPVVRSRRKVSKALFKSFANRRSLVAVSNTQRPSGVSSLSRPLADPLLSDWRGCPTGG